MSKPGLLNGFSAGRGPAPARPRAPRRRPRRSTAFVSRAWRGAPPAQQPGGRTSAAVTTAVASAPAATRGRAGEPTVEPGLESAAFDLAARVAPLRLLHPAAPRPRARIASMYRWLISCSSRASTASRVRSSSAPRRGRTSSRCSAAAVGDDPAHARFSAAREPRLSTRRGRAAEFAPPAAHIEIRAGPASTTRPRSSDARSPNGLRPPAGASAISRSPRPAAPLSSPESR